MNCAAIPGSLLESELFGYEKGSFTGAYNSRAGKFEQAHDGSMVLDEIADIDSGLQAKLLQVLQDGCYSRIGDLEERSCDVRIMCITNRDIQAEIQSGRFREDLYYRINVVNIQMPPLRRRLDDLPTLVDYFLKSYSERFERRVQPLSSTVMERFRQHHWPGNIRELENYLKRYVILESPDSILNELEERRTGPTNGGEFQLPPVTDFSLKKYSKQASQKAEHYLILEAPDSILNELEERRTGPTNGGGFQLPPVTDFSLKKYSKQASQKAEHYLILEALKNTRWNRKRAAELLGISYRALLYKIKEAGLPQKKRA